LADPHPRGRELRLRHAAAPSCGAAGAGPRTVPDVARRYCISRSTARLVDVYAAAVSRSPSPLSPLGASTS
ncbi:glycosyl transferase, partial [Streptomyces flaveolus]